MKELTIDVRMAFHAGIGTYIRNIVPALANTFKLKLIASEELVHRWPFLAQNELILTSAPIYSIEEQIKFPFLIPASDIFWTPHYNAPLAHLKAKKRVVTIHDVYHLAFSENLNLLQRIYAKLVIHRVANISDHILTISQFSKDEIVKYTGISREKISLTYLGVDRTYFTEDDDDQKYPLPANYFLFVGTLAPHKNIGRLVESWKKVVAKFPSWKLVLVGKRVKNRPLQRVLDSNPSLEQTVLFLENVENKDLPGIYRKAYAVVHPSLYEGFGLTLLEAMSSGCPTIVSKAASLPEVCGDSAFYIDPYDIENIAAGMEKLILDKNLYNDLKIKGLKRPEDFTWEQTIQKHVETMETLL